MMKRSIQTKLLEAGCDEAGRGPLAGPVVGAAVILPKKFKHALLNDSKQVSEANRLILKDYIEQHALAWAIGIVDHQEIDKLNILNATFLAIHRALDQLKPKAEYIAMDGNRFANYPFTPHECIVKGDSKLMNIAAASILAKTTRDEIMKQYHQEYPMYGWEQNKGYPTRKHREAIQEFGVSPIHRMSFKLLKEENGVNER